MTCFNSSQPLTPATTRFFAIAKKLPMELQMILCHRGRWLSEAEYSSQGFRGRLQIPRQDSSTSFFSVEVGFKGHEVVACLCLDCFEEWKEKKKEKEFFIYMKAARLLCVSP